MATTKQILKDIGVALGDIMAHIREATTATCYPEKDKLLRFWNTFYCIHSGTMFTVLSNKLLHQCLCPDCKRLARAVHWTIPRKLVTRETLAELSQLLVTLESQNDKPLTSNHGMTRLTVPAIPLKEVTDGD